MPFSCNPTRKVKTSRVPNAAECNYTLTTLSGGVESEDIILGYDITVYTDHAALTELFKGRNLMENCSLVLYHSSLLQHLKTCQVELM